MSETKYVCRGDITTSSRPLHLTVSPYSSPSSDMDNFTSYKPLHRVKTLMHQMNDFIQIFNLITIILLASSIVVGLRQIYFKEVKMAAEEIEMAVGRKKIWHNERYGMHYSTIEFKYQNWFSIITHHCENQRSCCDLGNQQSVPLPAVDSTRRYQQLCCWIADSNSIQENSDGKSSNLVGRHSMWNLIAQL